MEPKPEPIDRLIDELGVSVARACSTIERLQIQRNALVALVVDGIEAATLGELERLAWASCAERALVALELAPVEAPS